MSSTREATLALIDVLGRGPEDYGLKRTPHSSDNEASKHYNNLREDKSSSRSQASSSTGLAYAPSTHKNHIDIACQAQAGIQLVEMGEESQHSTIKQSGRDSGYGTVLTEPWETDVSSTYLASRFHIIRKLLRTKQSCVAALATVCPESGCAMLFTGQEALNLHRQQQHPVSVASSSQSRS